MNTHELNLCDFVIFNVKPGPIIIEEIISVEANTWKLDSDSNRRRKVTKHIITVIIDKW